jgi:hypothetical protein
MSQRRIITAVMAGVAVVFLVIVADPAVRPAMQAFGFTGTPHFFLRAADGTVVWSQQGAVPEAELMRRLEAVSR